MSKRDDPQLRVRIPSELKDALELKARRSNRTLTAEIVSRLDTTIAQDEFMKEDIGHFTLLVEYDVLQERFDELWNNYNDECRVTSAMSNIDEFREAISHLNDLLNRKK